jgi:predicted DNA-binding transcriptional regulator
LADDKTIGGIILIGSLAGLVIYFWLLFMSPYSWFVIQLSAFLVVAMVLLLIAWIGYTLAITPPPMPLEDFDFESKVGEETEEETP